MRLHDDRGAVALITTIIISLLLIIITTGLIATMSSELRQEDDAEQSSLAYYAAQSGVEDAVRQIVGGSRTNQDCSSAGSQNLSLDLSRPGVVGWTCQIIQFSGQPHQPLPQPDRAVQVNPGTGVTYDSVKIEWDTNSNPIVPYYSPSLTPIPPAGAWSYAAGIELAISQYPKGSFPSSDARLQLRNLLLMPSNSGAAPTVSYASLGIVPPGSGVNPIPGSCTYASVAYHCSAFLTVDSNDAYLFRIRSRFTGTAFQLSFSNGGSPVKVPDGTATIDVTAKAGDAYRRVVYQIPFTQSAANGLDFVMYSDKDICKNFTVLTGIIQSDSCPP